MVGVGGATTIAVVVTGREVSIGVGGGVAMCGIWVPKGGTTQDTGLGVAGLRVMDVEVLGIRVGDGIGLGFDATVNLGN